MFVKYDVASLDNTSSFQASRVCDLQASLHRLANTIHYSHQIRDGELIDVAGTLQVLMTKVSSLDEEHSQLLASHEDLNTPATSTLARIDDSRSQLAQCTRMQENEQANIRTQLSLERHTLEDSISRRQQVLTDLQTAHHTLETQFTQDAMDTASMKSSLDAVKTETSLALDAARARATKKMKTLEAGLVQLTSDLGRRWAKVDKLIGAGHKLEADNASLAEQLAESQKEVAELRTWHGDLEKKRGEDQVEYDAQCAEIFRQIAASEDAREDAEDRARKAEKIAKAAVEDLNTSQDLFVAELAKVRARNAVLVAQKKDLVSEHEDLQTRLINQQMAHYRRVDDILALIQGVEANERPPLRTPAIRQRESQMISLEGTIEVLKLTESALGQMVEEEVQSRGAAEDKLLSIMATVKYIDSPSLRNSPTPVFDDGSPTCSDTPSLTGTPDRSVSQTPELDTPGLVLFDADGLCASVSCNSVDPGTTTRVSAGLGLGLDLGI